MHWHFRGAFPTDLGNFPAGFLTPFSLVCLGGKGKKTTGASLKMPSLQRTVPPHLTQMPQNEEVNCPFTATSCNTFQTPTYRGIDTLSRGGVTCFTSP